MNADMRFQIEQLKYDNQQLAQNYEKEKQALEVVRKLYNNNFVRETVEAETQTDGISQNSYNGTKPLYFRQRPESGKLPST